MSKTRSSSVTKSSLSSSSKASKALDDETQKEIDRQQALLLANLDRKQLRGNVTMEDYRHSRQTANLTQNERRERYEISSQRKELLHDLRKVRSSYTGHYDASKTPLENIQQALRTKSQTPAKSSRLAAPGMNNFAIRRCVSSEALRPSSSLAVVGYGHAGSSGMNVTGNRSKSPNSQINTRPKTAAPSVASHKTKKGENTEEKLLKKDKR